jgi:hypothetical protein
LKEDWFAKKKEKNCVKRDQHESELYTRRHYFMGHQDCSKCNYRIFDTSVIISKLQKIYLAPYFTTQVR